MFKAPVDELTPGKILAVDVRVQSTHPGTLYRLKIDEDTEINQKHIERLRKAGVPYVFIRNKHTDDLNKKIYDRDLDYAEQDVLEDLKSVELKIEAGRPDEISMEEIEDSLTELIKRLRDTEAMMVFQTLKAHHDYTIKHSLEVAKLTLHMFLSRQEEFHQQLLDETGASSSYTAKYMLEDIGIGALLHDVGKWEIPPDVLNKNDSLDLQEWEAMKTHPRKGHEILTDIDDDLRAPVRVPALQHHEKYGGGGYPEERIGTNIHLYGRVTAVADVFSALTSKRPYRIALTPNRAFETMGDMQREDVHFDPDIYQTFRELVPPFPIGQKVILGDGKMGVVSELGENWMQPTVRVIAHKNKEVSEPYEITANTKDGPKIVN